MKKMLLALVLAGVSCSVMANEVAVEEAEVVVVADQEEVRAEEAAEEAPAAE